MKLCRFQTRDGALHVGLRADESTLLDLRAAGIQSLTPLLESDHLVSELNALQKRTLPRVAAADVRLLAPVERQEIWAAGVTYLRSKKARMDESDFSATAYDRVYEAPRPELFFKSMPEKVAGPGDAVGIRNDSKWNVPEPELTLFINSRGKIAGYSIGNDMSSRDIEGENLLYLPQAKIYRSSCAIGPFIRVGVDEPEARTWSIQLSISRSGEKVFEGATSVANIRRKLDDLAQYLFRSQLFPNGAALLTGTGIVPPDTFTLQAGDEISISISGIGELRNSVVQV
jgi:2-dehydro-3-deoxy-D-arabinonate dehydratase